MFWAGMNGSKLIGPYEVPEGMNIHAKAYCELLDRFLLPWLEDQPLLLRKSLICQHDNAPAPKAKHTTNWLKGYSFGEDKLMIWPANTSDLNPIDHLWTITKRRVYLDGRQVSNCADLWKAVEDAASSITPVDIKKLTTKVDSRVWRFQNW